ncbi:hypothetical protein [Vibrio splendidus]|uniref:hypothetical protein n=1 Tax=Vibrio splendidus TaxID=29497 RepID=UPI003D0A2FD1
MIGASFSHFKSPHDWRFTFNIRAWRLECAVYEALTLYPSISDYQPKVSSVVELKHWKMAKPMAAVICIGVVTLYIIFSPLGIAN